MTDLVSRLWATEDPELLFGRHDRTMTPWPSVPRSKHRPLIDLENITAMLDAPVSLRDVDPRTLYANQPWILREHVEYYRTAEWERTGHTSADRFDALNQFPVVTEDHRGRPVIVVGHHRAAAALIAGRPLRVRAVAHTAPYAVTPLLLVDPSRRPPARGSVVDDLRAGASVTVATVDEAAAVLARLGVDDIAVQWRLGWMRRLLPNAKVSARAGWASARPLGHAGPAQWER